MLFPIGEMQSIRKIMLIQNVEVGKRENRKTLQTLDACIYYIEIL